MKKELQMFLILSLFSVVLFGQSKSISGKVTDENNIPLPGTNIAIQGLSNGTTTDFDGNYDIEVETNNILLYSFSGYITQKITIGNQSTINVILSPNKEALSEVVVTAFGIKRDKQSFGATTQIINTDELNKGAQTSIGNALKGKVAGGIITTASTDPGASTGIILRGFTSLFPGEDRNQPLIIVDGIPINNESTFTSNLEGAIDFGRGIDDLNPEDIESINVIKGTSASALYGGRAANGALIIETKKGQEGKIKVNISSQYTISDVLRVPEYQSSFGQGFGGGTALGENVSYGSRLDGQSRVWGRVISGTQQFKPFSFQKDQLRNFFETGAVWANNVAISGGKQGTTGRLSFSSRDMDGIMPDETDTNRRNTVGFSFSSDHQWVKFSGTANYVNTKGTSTPTGQGLTVYNNVLQIPNDIDISGLEDQNNPFNSLENYFTSFALNPFWILRNRRANLEEERFYGSMAATLKLTKNVNLTYRGGLDNTQKRITTYQSAINLPTDLQNSSQNQSGFFAQADLKNKQITHNVILAVDGKFNTDFSVTTNTGFEYNVIEQDVFTTSVSSQDLPNFFSLSNSATTPIIGRNSILGSDFIDDGFSEVKRIGVFNTATFSYKDFLYLTGNTRIDWSSTIPEKNRLNLYGGINGAWIFSKHTSKNSVLNFGKLRVGYGETGVDAPKFSVFSDNEIANIGNGLSDLIFPVNGVNAFEEGNRLANFNLKPERRREFEIGTELSFIDNRLQLDATFYVAKIKDLIGKLNIAPSTGVTSQIANLLDYRNMGFESLVNVNWIKNHKGFSWSTGYNFSLFDSEVEKINVPLGQLSLVGLNEGTSLIAKEGSPLLLEGKTPSLTPSGQIIVDARGIPIAAAENEIYGDTQVDYAYGLTNTFKYKGITFEFTLDAREGGLLYSKTAETTQFTGNSVVTTFNDRKPFVVPNSVQIVGDPIDQVYETNTTPIDDSSLFEYTSSRALDRNNVIDKSFVKLREVILAYDFNNEIFDKWNLPIDKLSLSIVGRNLLLWTPSDNKFIDPEVSTFGTGVLGQFGEFLANPTTRSLTFQLKAQF